MASVPRPFLGSQHGIGTLERSQTPVRNRGAARKPPELEKACVAADTAQEAQTGARV